MQGNDVNQQSNGMGTNTNYINNISAVAENNRQMNNTVNQQPNNFNNSQNMNNIAPQGQGEYVEPPKKKNSVLTFIVIFLILAVSAVGGYFIGQYVYNVTHPDTADNG